MQTLLAHRSPFSTLDRLDRVVNINDAAAIIGVSVWTLKRRSQAGKLTILKLSPRRLGMRLSEIQRFLEASEVHAA
jgi:predicted site-specific integrase-resolvase